MNNTAEKIRVLICDHSEVICRGLEYCLTSIPDVELLGSVAEPAEAMKRIRELRPDVLVTDLLEPYSAGIRSIKDAKAESSELNILVLTSVVDPEKVIECITAGASGFCTLGASTAMVTQALRCVHAAGVWLDPSVKSVLTATKPAQQSNGSSTTTLTARELQVISLIASGYAYADIAEVLCISGDTVKTHVTNIFDKLDVCDRTSAAVKAIKLGMVDWTAKSKTCCVQTK